MRNPNRNNWRQLRVKQLLLVVMLGSAPTLFAAPMVEQLNRMEINWSSHKIRFYGESGPSENVLRGIEGAEKRAWADGLSFIEGQIRDFGISVFENLSSNMEKISAEASTAAKNITKNVYSYNTLYFGDGTVRVYLESSLPRALTTNLIRFRQKESASTQLMSRTGIVIRLNERVAPRARYKIVDETGMPLFDARDMSEEGFSRNLMGRWYEAPADAESAEFVGKNPIEISATLSHDGHFVVTRQVWKDAVDGHKALLVNGLIALVVPAPPSTL